MRTAILGGGPGGLYFAISLKLRDPAHEVVVIERNRPDDTFGWGVVLSDETLDNLAANDAESAEAIRHSFAYWDDIAVHYRGTVVRSGGHGFCGIARKRLLHILQDRARELGVELRFETEAEDPEVYRRDYDLIVGADGINSKVRAAYADRLQARHRRARLQVHLARHPPEIRRRLHLHLRGDRARLDLGARLSVRRRYRDLHRRMLRADLAEFRLRPMSTEETIAACEKIFAKNLGGHALMSNAKHLRGSAWLNFNRVLCERWSFDNVVLLGDAAATAHFSVGSGSKLAMESAIALAEYLHTEPTLADAFRRYEDERRLEVLRLQNAARNSTEWFEDVERYLHLDPVQFNYSLLTRSQRISHENLRQRDPEWLASAEKWFEQQATGKRPNGSRPPMFVAFKLRDLELKNRICVSPMAQYRAVDGLPNDWHFVHYAERAKGGAGLLFTEMTCVSPEGRISPGCTGLYDRNHERAWKRLVDFVHAETEAKIAIQLGHSGPKGSTQVGWETPDAPLVDGNWETVGPSCVAWSSDNPPPREMTRADMDKVREDFVGAAVMAERAGFDWLELHYAHGYLMSAFITPLTNRRTDEYGGSLENRMRFPLEVFHAVRKVWPQEKPISVRISAHDWVGPTGIMPQDAVAIARMLAENGVDIVDVSAGQTSVEAKPVYGRMFQTPFSDRIRNEAGMATLAVGNIYEPDHVNSILMAGRADLVCMARPHLADPYWTLHAAADLQYKGVTWPKPYRAGRDQLYRLKARAAETMAGKV